MSKTHTFKGIAKVLASFGNFANQQGVSSGGLGLTREISKKTLDFTEIHTKTNSYKAQG